MELYMNYLATIAFSVWKGVRVLPIVLSPLETPESMLNNLINYLDESN